MNVHTNKGFTLIELVIAMAIIGILASIAFPAYTEYVAKARRGDCAAELKLFANAVERSSTLRGTYVGGGGNFIGASCPIDGGTPVYNFVLDADVTATTYTVRAVPIGAQANDKCGQLTVTNTGTKGVDGATGGLTAADCW